MTVNRATSRHCKYCLHVLNLLSRRVEVSLWVISAWTVETVDKPLSFHPLQNMLPFSPSERTILFSNCFITSLSEQGGLRKDIYNGASGSSGWHLFFDVLDIGILLSAILVQNLIL